MNLSTELKREFKELYKGRNIFIVKDQAGNFLFFQVEGSNGQPDTMEKARKEIDDAHACPDEEETDYAPRM